MKVIQLPRVSWALGDAKDVTVEAVTKPMRPIYYREANTGPYRIVGYIDLDYTSELMHDLEGK